MTIEDFLFRYNHCKITIIRDEDLLTIKAEIVTEEQLFKLEIMLSMKDESKKVVPMIDYHLRTTLQKLDQSIPWLGVG